MNKVPGPPSSSPLPAPSPNLPPPNFSPTPPPSMVFATPTPPPMNPAAPPRQPFYPVRPTLPTNPVRGQASSAPRPIPPPHGGHNPHVFQPGSQMMMIQSQQISFPNSQGPAYYIPSQYRPSYVSPQQYQVTGSPNFYPANSPAEYAAAYYPAQPQFTPPVATAPVLMNPASQQQQAPPPQQHGAPTKRERKPIRIRDPNQGGKDITEEIMSGGRSASTPTPPQSALPGSEGGAIAQSNDEPQKSVICLEFPVPPGESPIPDTAPTPPPISPISDSVDAPPLAIDKDGKPPESTFLPAVVPSNTSGENGAGPVRAVCISLPGSGAEPALESPIAQPEELQLVNGLTSDANRDVSPLAEPDITQEAPPIIEERSTRTTKAVSPVVKETTAQVGSEALPLRSVKEYCDPNVKGTPAPELTPDPDVMKMSMKSFVTETMSVVAKDTPSVASMEIHAPVAKETHPPVVKEAPAPVVKAAPAPVIKASPAPVIKAAPAPVIKAAPAPVIKAAPAPVIKAAPAPVIKAAPAPVIKAAPAPVIKAAPAPVVKAAPAPVVKAAPAPVVKAAPAPVVKAAPAPVVKAAPAPVVKAAPAPVVKAAPAPVVKAAPAPVVKEAPAPVVKEAPAPVVKEAPAPVVKEAPAPVVKEAPAPVVKEAPAPVVKEAPAPVVKEAPAPVVKEAPAPVVKEAPAPVVKEAPAPVVKEAPAPVVKEAPAPVVKEAPAPVVKEAPAPVVKEAPAPVVKEAPAPVVKEAPAPVDKEAPAPVDKEAPAPVDKEAPAPVDKEAPAPVVKEAPAPVVKEAPAPVATETVVENPCPVAKEAQEPIVKEIPNTLEPVCVDAKAMAPPLPSPSAPAEEREDTPPPQTAPESTMQAVSIPKKKRKLKDLNKKETGDVLDAFKEPPPPKPEAAPQVKPEQVELPAVAPTPAEEAEETWEEKEDQLDAENIQPQSPSPATPTEQKYQYKAEQWKPLNPEEKKKYDREFLLGFQFLSASMHKPEGLPHISDVVLDKVNKTPLRPLDLSRMNCGPDFTPTFANLGRQPAGGRGPAMGLPGPRRSGQSGSRKEPRKIVLSGVSLNDDIQLNKAENAWRRGGAPEKEDPETLKTQELLRRVRGVLNKLTPQMFQSLMKQITEMTIDTEERLKGVIDLVFEKAISEPNFSVAYANMCRCLIGLKVPTSDKPGVSVNFRKLLLNRCQKEFEKDKDDDEAFEKKQKELDAATGDEVRQRLKAELEEAKDAARRRSLGNIKFIGELFKLKMLTETIMHDCVVKLLKNHDEESLECLCRLLSTIGKDLDFEKARPRMDQYFNQMDKIIKEKKTSSRIRFMLQDVNDLRRNNWVPRRGDQGPKTIEQIHKDAQMEEQREQIKVQQQLFSKKDSRGGGGGGGGGITLGPRGSGSHRGNQPQDDGWNTVPISTKNRPIDTSRLSKITKPGAMDFNNQLLAPGGKGSWGSWGKGSSGGSGAKPTEGAQESGRASTLNRFSALQQPPSSSLSSSNMDTDRRVPQRNSSSRERGDRLERGPDRNRPAITKRSFSREKDEWEPRPAEMVRRVASMTDERERTRERERAHSKDNVRKEPVSTPPPAPSKPALSPEDLEKKSTAIIEEYLHINDMKEALQCVSELNCASLLYVFVRTGIESTLERSTIAREHMGLLLHQLVKAGTLSHQQYYKGLMEVLEVAEDMAIDVPHIWVYLAELIAPVLHEGGIPMGSLFREVSKPLVPISKAGDLLAHILTLLCKGMSHKKVGIMWREAGLSWKDFLSEKEDLNKFVTEKGLEYTMDEECVKVGSSPKSLSVEEISKHLDQLLQDKCDNQRIFNWVEAKLDEQQASSNAFVRALMATVCQTAIICETPYKVDTKEITQRAKLLQRYIKDEQKELQALYALQSLMVKLEQPPNLLRMFFDVLYDEDIIKEDGFYKWESSKDPAEQQGKGVALKSVTAFYTWLRNAEDESDNS